MSSIDAVLSVPPTDDAGAQTADRYEWQAAMAAADGLGAFVQHLDGSLSHLDRMEIRVICEYHEDWIVQAGHHAELVSAKHRENSAGPWRSITDLVSDGGVGHLFARWLMLSRKASTRLVTNASTAAGEASEFARCREYLAKLDAGIELGVGELEALDGCLDVLCRAIMMYRKGLPQRWKAAQKTRAQDQIVPDDLRAAVRGFMLQFRLDLQRPERAFTRHAAPSLYVKPLLESTGRPHHLAEPVWEAVVQLFRIRMRSHGPTRNGGLPALGPTDPLRAFSHEIESRTVSLQDILITVETAVSNPEAYRPVPRTQRISKLGVKMAQGGCSDTSIERAERLKIEYSSYRRERRNSVPGSEPEIRRVERILHRIADEETQKVRTRDALWGDKLWAALSTRLRSDPEDLSTLQVDGELGLGGISELTARCRVWYSEHFDVEAVIANAKLAKMEK